MDFAVSERAERLRERVAEFMDEHVLPVEAEAIEAWDEEVAPGLAYPRVVVEMRGRAKAEGLWNLFLPDERFGPGLSNWEYGLLCETMGRSPIIAPMAFNCAAPDTGNMEILAEFGTLEQQERWLEPQLEGHTRSAFSMTEPDSSGSDPTGLRTQARLEGDDWVIRGHKWFTSGAVGADFAIAMVVTEPDAAPHQRASMIIVPIDSPGFELIRSVSFMGEAGNSGHCEIRYDDCRVPKSNLLGARGEGFAIAQARLGPGRIHHCMRAIGVAERALEYICRRANTRSTRGERLADKQIVQDVIARSRMEIDSARLMVLHAAWKMDTVGKAAARQEISMIKVIAANVVMDVLDRAVQILGALGTTDDTPISRLWREMRTLRLADGPDEVHKLVIARRELQRWTDALHSSSPLSGERPRPTRPRGCSARTHGPRSPVARRAPGVSSRQPSPADCAAIGDCWILPDTRFRGGALERLWHILVDWLGHRGGGRDRSPVRGLFPQPRQRV